MVRSRFSPVQQPLLQSRVMETRNGASMSPIGRCGRPGGDTLRSARPFELWRTQFSAGYHAKVAYYISGNTVLCTTLKPTHRSFIRGAGAAPGVARFAHTPRFRGAGWCELPQKTCSVKYVMLSFNNHLALDDPLAGACAAAAASGAHTLPIRAAGAGCNYQQWHEDSLVQYCLVPSH